MTIDFEKTIADSLRTRADRDVDAHALLTGATGRARVIGIRRKLLAVGAFAAVVAVTGAVVAAAPQLLAGRGAQPAAPSASTSPSAGVPIPGVTPPPPGGYRVPSLPSATGVAGAATRPDLVGTDPAVLHFDLDAAAAGSYMVSWAVGEGHESVDIGRPTNRLRLDLGPDLAKLDGLNRMGRFSDIWESGASISEGDPVEQPRQAASVGGLPGTLDETRYGAGGVEWVLRWQPVKGLWARVQGRGVSRDDVLAFAEKVPAGLQRSRRCVVPVEIAKLPAGLRWTGCGVQFIGYDRSQDSSWILTFRDSNGRAVGLMIGQGMVTLDDSGAARTVAGHQAWWVNGTLTVKYADGNRITVDFWPRGVPGAEATATRLAEAVQPRGEPSEPATWPTRAVG
jgi:hypothetical protein